MFNLEGGTWQLAAGANLEKSAPPVRELSTKKVVLTSIAKRLVPWCIPLPLLRQLRVKLNPGLSVLAFHEVPMACQKKLALLLCYMAREHLLIDPQSLTSNFDAPDVGRRSRALLSFDDGFVSQYRVAKEVLEPLGLKAIFFVCPTFVDSSREQQRKFVAEKLFADRLDIGQVPESMLAMSWDQLKELVERGHLVGAHSLNHPRLSLMKKHAELEKEIVASGDLLQSRLGVPVYHFATPFGKLRDTDQRALKLVAGRYRFCFSTIAGVNEPNRHPHAILRTAISLQTPYKYLCLQAENGLGWKYRKQARQLQKMAVDSTSGRQ